MEENGYKDGDTYMVNGNMSAVKNVLASPAHGGGANT